jgi:DNA-binding CsgD family transcriptional regulator
MPLAEQIDFTFGVTTALVALASMAQIRGELREAGEMLERAETIARAAGDGLSLYHALYWQGEVARSAGQYDRAVSLLEESLALTRQHGNAWLVATALFSLGHVALMRGQSDDAAALFRETLAIRRPLRDQFGIALSVEALAWVASAERQPERAALLFGAAVGLRERIGASVDLGWMSDHQRFLEQTSAELDEATFATRWAAGRALPPEEAVGLALASGARTGGSAAAANDVRAMHAPGRLTAREVEVAALIARGYSNRQIADQLVVARGTVANHVAHILEKLGFQSRAQVAAWAVQQQVAGLADRE